MPLDIARIKALCFDVDGTLSDTDDVWVNRLGRFIRPVKWLLPGRDEIRVARAWVMAAETPTNILYKLADQFHLDDDLLRILAHMPFRERKQAPLYQIIPGVMDMLIRLGKVLSHGGSQRTR